MFQPCFFFDDKKITMVQSIFRLFYCTPEKGAIKCFMTFYRMTILPYIKTGTICLIITPFSRMKYLEHVKINEHNKCT